MTADHITWVANPAELGASRRDEMFALMDRYYENMARAAFEADLDEKHWVIGLSASAGRSSALLGFSTLRLLEAEMEGERVLALFSGDTIMEQRARPSGALSVAFARLALEIAAAHPDRPVYWFLISKGYKTYRLLPLFFHTYYPAFDRETPEEIRRVIAAFAVPKFGASFDPVAGIIRAATQGCRLREGVAAISPERLKDPHVRFFAEANPGHPQGDELCCLARISEDNITPAALRAAGRDWKRGGADRPHLGAIVTARENRPS